MSYRLYEEAKEKFCDALAEIVEGKQRFNADDLRLAKEAISGLYKATILMEMENGDYSYADGMSYAKRDSRGRYSRESGGNYSNRGGNRGGGYPRDYSYRYSRDEAKKDMAEEIKELMQYAENETERSVLRQAAEMLKNNTEK
jgi:hypothetical protein